MTGEIIVGKGEIAQYEKFLLLPQLFLPYQRNVFDFTLVLILVCKLFQFGTVQNMSFGDHWAVGTCPVLPSTGSIIDLSLGIPPGIVDPYISLRLIGNLLINGLMQYSCNDSWISNSYNRFAPSPRHVEPNKPLIYIFVYHHTFQEIKVIILLLVLALYYPVQDLYLIYIRGIPPGPISLPLIGNLHLLSPRTPHLSLNNLYKKYGPVFSLRMGPFGRAILVGRLQEIDEVCQNPDANDRPKMPFLDIINNGSDGIGSCESGSDKWKYLVKVLLQGQAKFSNANLYKKVHPYFIQLMQRFEVKAEKNYDLRFEVLKSISAIFSSIIYGIKTDGLDCEHLHSRIKHHNLIMSCLNPSHILNLLPITWKIPTTLKRNILACIQHREDLMSKNLRCHIEDDRGWGEVRDMMDIIAQSVTHNPTSMQQKGVTDKDMLISTWTYFVAGCDTTVDMISWLLLYLSVYTDVQKNIQEEIKEVFAGNEENILDKKAYLHYTRATILETLRISSPIAMGIPHSNSVDTKISGYHIPKDSLIMLTQWTVHHDDTFWPEPYRLKPERFLDKDGALLSTHHIFKKMPFIPFSRGIRTCLGQYMALDILLMFVCRTLQTYNVHIAENCTPDLNGEVVLSVRPKSVPVVFQRRQDSSFNLKFF